MKKTATTPPPAAPAAAPAEAKFGTHRRTPRGVLYTVSEDDVKLYPTLKADDVITVTAYPSGDGWSLIGHTDAGGVLRFPNRTQADKPTAGQWHDANTPATEPATPPPPSPPAE